MKIARGTWPEWPPTKNYSEEEGCHLIMDMLQTAAQKMVVDVLGPLDNQQELHLRNRIEDAGRKGLDDWKRFATARSPSSLQTAPDPVGTSKIKKTIDQPHPPRHRRKK